jgi:hypothetical protein
MATPFVRLVQPHTVTFPRVPGGFASLGLSGKVQLRASARAGRAWSESYSALRVSNATVRQFLALLDAYAHQQTILDVDHPDLRDLLGTGAGNPEVDGADQVGSSLVTDGWGTAQTVLRAGDVIRIAGLPLVYTVTADVASDGGGAATVPLSPPIFAGSSPADNADLVCNTTPGAVQFQVFIEQLVSPASGPGGLLLGLQVAFRETG